MTPQEMERRIWVLEDHIRKMQCILLRIQEDTHVYMGICVNGACNTGHARHPHWDHPKDVDYSHDIIHI